jgi:hypothetical protein
MIEKEQLDERTKDSGYDDSPWTDGEMDMLAEEAGELLDRYEPWTSSATRRCSAGCSRGPKTVRGRVR